MITHAFFALHVVHSALIRVAQYLVCVGHLLELYLGGLGVIRVLVRVKLNRLLLKSLLYLLLCSVLFYAHHFVVVSGLGLLLLLGPLGS